MSELTREQIYQEVNNLLVDLSIQEGEVYVTDFARDTGRDLRQARSMIQALEREGEVQIRVVAYPRRGMVFRLIRTEKSNNTGKKRKSGIKTF